MSHYLCAGLGARVIPFQGVKGQADLRFDMVWTAATFVGNDIVADVKGLNPRVAHQVRVNPRLLLFTPALPSAQRR